VVFDELIGVEDVRADLRAPFVRAALTAQFGEALIAHLELRIEKLKRELHGQRSERTARLIEQLELELEELATTATEDELAAQAAAAKVQNVRCAFRGIVSTDFR
jgi:hypothetical protein